MSIDTDEIALILSGVKILQDLDVEIIRDIACHTQIEKFETGDMIVKSGEVGSRIYFIFEGKVEVQIPDIQGDIKSRILLKKGEVVGEISLLINSNYSADIEALTKTTAFYLDRDHFKELIERHPDFAEVMSQLMTSRMAQNGGINRVGKYELRGKLGEGNMATVFNAWDPELEREVAIKMLKYKLAYNDRFRDRFEREAKTDRQPEPSEYRQRFRSHRRVLHPLHRHGKAAWTGPFRNPEGKRARSELPRPVQFCRRLRMPCNTRTTMATRASCTAISSHRTSLSMPTAIYQTFRLRYRQPATGQGS